MPGYYDRDFDPWVSNIRNIGSMLAQAPALRARAQQNQALAEERQQRGAYYNSEIGKTQAETADIQQGTAGNAQLSGALRKLTANPNDPAALADAFEGTAKALRKDPEGTAKGLGTLLGQLQTLKGGTNALPMAAQLTEPNKVYSANATQAAANYGADARARSLADVARINLQKPIVDTGGAPVLDYQGHVMNSGRVVLRPGERLFTGNDSDATSQDQEQEADAPAVPENADGYEPAPDERAAGGSPATAAAAAPAPSIATKLLNYNATPAASGAPMQPKSSGTDLVRSRFLAKIMSDPALARKPQVQKAMMANYDSVVNGSADENADATTPPAAAPQAATANSTTTMTPAQKAARANQLAAQNPKWTRAQVLSALQKELAGQ